MHFFDWALLALVAFAAALALRKIWRDRRAGKCCGNCTACTAGCAAHARGLAACAPNERETAPNTPRTAPNAPRTAPNCAKHTPARTAGCEQKSAEACRAHPEPRRINQ